MYNEIMKAPKKINNHSPRDQKWGHDSWRCRFKIYILCAGEAAEDGGDEDKGGSKGDDDKK